MQRIGSIPYKVDFKKSRLGIERVNTANVNCSGMNLIIQCQILRLARCLRFIIHLFVILLKTVIPQNEGNRSCQKTKKLQIVVHVSTIDL